MSLWHSNQNQTHPPSPTLADTSPLPYRESTQLSLTRNSYNNLTDFTVVNALVSSLQRDCSTIFYYRGAMYAARRTTQFVSIPIIVFHACRRHGVSATWPMRVTITCEPILASFTTVLRLFVVRRDVGRSSHCRRIPSKPFGTVAAIHSAHTFRVLDTIIITSPRSNFYAHYTRTLRSTRPITSEIQSYFTRLETRLVRVTLVGTLSF